MTVEVEPGAVRAHGVQGCVRRARRGRDRRLHGVWQWRRRLGRGDRREERTRGRGDERLAGVEDEVLRGLARVPEQLLVWDIENLDRHAARGGDAAVVEQLARDLRQADDHGIAPALGEEPLSQRRRQASLDAQLAAEQPVRLGVRGAQRAAVALAHPLAARRHRLEDPLEHLLLVGVDRPDRVGEADVVRPTPMRGRNVGKVVPPTQTACREPPRAVRVRQRHADQGDKRGPDVAPRRSSPVQGARDRHDVERVAGHAAPHPRRARPRSSQGCPHPPRPRATRSF